jgi:hypothetical protein
MSERIGRFVRNFVTAAGNCILEDYEVLVPAILAMACAGMFLLFYHIIFDPDSADISSRLAFLSINPDKWR